MGAADDKTSAETALALGRPRRPLAEQRSLAALKGRLFGTPDEPVKLSRYVLLDRIGAGGMGAVYSAYDPQLDRKVAIKLLLAREGTEDDDARVRLLREAQALARVAHPNIVPVYDVGTYDEQDLHGQESWAAQATKRGVFVVMELVVGSTLAEWLAKGERPWREVLAVFLQAGRGLASAHEQGLVHRDFKPANVVVGLDGRARVLDFGLARALSEEHEFERRDEPPSPDSPSLLDSPLTRSGTVMGTPRYMAPEQHDGASADPSADQFSFCAALYEGLYRTRAFVGDDLDSIKTSKRAGGVRRPVATRVPNWIYRAVARGMDPDPARRFESMQALLDGLEEGLRRRRLWTLVGIGGVGLGAALALVSTAQGEQECTAGAERVAEVWNDSTRRSVAAPFEASQLPFAGASLTTVLARMDAQAEAWARMYDEACAATHLRHEQSAALLDLRMGCLSERMVELDALAEVLSSADDEMLEHAAQAAAELSPLSTCADAAGLRELERARKPTDVPEDPQLRGHIAQARVRLNAARYDEALTMIEPLVDGAGLPARSRAELGLLHGRIERALGNPERAEKLIFDALLAAREADDPVSELELLLELSSLVSSARVDLDEAQRWLELAGALVQRTEADSPSRARLERALGRLAIARGDNPAALPHLVRAMELAQEAYGADSPAVGPYAFAVAEVYRDRGEWEASEELLQRVLELRRERLGAAHPAVAETHEALGTLHVRRGEWKLALAAHQRALAIREESFGPEHPSIAGALNNIASAHAALGEEQRAVDALSRALEIALAHFGTQSARVAPYHSNLGTMLADVGDLVHAREHTERALEIVSSAYGPSHPHVAFARQNTAHVYERMGEPERAIEAYRGALETWEAAEGPDHFMVLNALNEIARVHLDADQAQQALPVAERSVSILERGEIAAVDAGTSRFLLARAMWAVATEPARALDLASAARDDFARADGAEGRVGEVDSWLAERRNE